MATAYTSLLGLALPVTGELQGTWGTAVNDSITSLLDTAVAGTTTLSTDGDVTLTTTTGASNQARQAILLCSGARTALRTITAPAQSKIYTVINATTGGFSVKVVGVGPTTGVTIVAGESALIAWNGSDFIKISNTGGSASFTNVTVSGTTTLSGLTASTALALNASKEVVSVTNTGTGNNVLSASPTLTGTIGGASMTLSSLTSGRVTYAGASGLLQDSANFTFNGTDLTVSGAVNAGSVNATTLDLTNLEVTNIKAKDGTASASIADSTGVMSLVSNPVLSGGTANGVLYLDGSKVATSGSALTFDGTNLGVGAAASALTTYRGAEFAGTTATTGGFLRMRTSDSSIISLDFTDSNGRAIFTTTNHPVRFGVNDSEQMRLTSTGLGIGTSSPGYKLDVSGAAGISARVKSTSGSTGNYAQLILDSYNSFSGTGQAYIRGVSSASGNSNTDLTFGVNNSGFGAPYEAMRLDSSGNLGIGTSSPGYKLDISAPNDSTARVRLLTTTGYNILWSSNNSGGTWVGTEGSAGGALMSGTPAWASVITSTVAAPLCFGINTTEQMRLDSSGNLGLGVTPSAWGTSEYKAAQIGNGASFYGRVASGDQDKAGMSSNAYNNGSNWLYIATDSAAKYDQIGGGHYWYTAPSGTAGNAISFTQAMTLTASGNLLVGTSVDNGYRLALNYTSGPYVTDFFNSNTSTNQYNVSLWRQAASGSAIGYIGTGGSAVVNTSFANNFVVGTQTSSPLVFNTGDTERMRLDSSGNLGLGVTPSAWRSASKALQIGQGASFWANTANPYAFMSSNAFLNSSSQDIYIVNGHATTYTQQTGQHIWYTAPSGTAGNAISFSQVMTLDASGNLGVGTTSPTSGFRLDVQAATARQRIESTTGTNQVEQRLTNTGGTLYLALDNSTGSGFGAAYSAVLWHTGNYPMLFATNNSERARITSGGDFGIGNNNPQYRLTVDKDTTSALAFFTNSNASAPNGLYVDFSAASPNNATQYFLYCEDSTAQRATIRSNGGLANYQSNNVDLSDSRTKKDIAPAASMWSKIGALEIVTYKYNDQTHDDVNVGVIAQQVEQVEPVWVDSDGFGETPEDGVPLKTVYTKDITFAAIKALQEAMTRIEQLEARVAALEAK